MSEERLARLLGRFAAAAKAHYEALESLDDVRADSHARVIAGLHEAIVSEGEAGRKGLLALTYGENGVVAGMAAVYSIRYNPERCLEVLRKLAAEEGLLGFRARVALERWDKGELDA